MGLHLSEASKKSRDAVLDIVRRHPVSNCYDVARIAAAEHVELSQRGNGNAKPHHVASQCLSDLYDAGQLDRIKTAKPGERSVWHYALAEPGTPPRRKFVNGSVVRLDGRKPRGTNGAAEATPAPAAVSAPPPAAPLVLAPPSLPGAWPNDEPKPRAFVRVERRPVVVTVAGRELELTHADARALYWALRDFLTGEGEPTERK